MVRRERPDLVLMDLRMPVMNGFEAIELLMAGPGTRDIPILAVTGQVMEEDKKRAAEVGALGFITKPIDIEQLKAEISRIFNASK